VFLLRRRVTGDLLAGLMAILMEAWSVVSVLHVVIDGRLWYRPLLFHVVVILMIGWSAMQWWRTSIRAKSDRTMFRSLGE